MGIYPRSSPVMSVIRRGEGRTDVAVVWREGPAPRRLGCVGPHRPGREREVRFSSLV